MSGSNIYYTLDGSAPVNWFNNDDGALSPTAKPYTEGDNILDEMSGSVFPDTIMLRAICYKDDEWSPIVTVRLAVDTPNLVEMRNEELRMKNEGVFDLAGRQIVNSKLSNSKLRQGVFIVNGKKKVVR